MRTHLKTLAVAAVTLALLAWFFRQGTGELCFTAAPPSRKNTQLPDAIWQPPHQ